MRSFRTDESRCREIANARLRNRGGLNERGWKNLLESINGHANDPIYALTEAEKPAFKEKLMAVWNDTDKWNSIIKEATAMGTARHAATRGTELVRHKAADTALASTLHDHDARIGTNSKAISGIVGVVAKHEEDLAQLKRENMSKECQIAELSTRHRLLEKHFGENVSVSPDSHAKYETELSAELNKLRRDMETKFAEVGGGGFGKKLLELTEAAHHAASMAENIGEIGSTVAEIRQRSELLSAEVADVKTATTIKLEKAASAFEERAAELAALSRRHLAEFENAAKVEQGVAMGRLAAQAAISSLKKQLKNKSMRSWSPVGQYSSDPFFDVLNPSGKVPQ